MGNRAATFVLITLITAGAASAPSTRPATAPATRPASAPATSTAPASAPALAVKKTTLDGVWTAEQVARGKKLYEASCARCHGDTLGGNDDAVALVGPEFTDKWAGKPVGDLEEYCRTQMPGDGPGRFNRKEITDMTVYILSANNLPAGKTELAPELDALNAVTIQVKK